MSSFILRNESDHGMTSIPNLFFDQYMPKANGEYVKVYLCLLRAFSGRMDNLSVSALADTLDHTENDILRALRYWEAQGLLRLEWTGDVLQGIYLLDMEKAQAVPTTVLHAALPKKTYSRDKLAAFSQKSECRQLLFVCEQYLKRPLSPKEIETLLYFNDELGFSTDLIEYLVEYCVSKGSRSIHYIETVALSWAEAGISTVSEAKERTTTYRRGCFAVMKAFGIGDRNPVESELRFIEKWMDTYGFTQEVILSACSRTMERLHKPNFEYADRILTDWKEKNVRSLKDVEALDQKFQQSARRSNQVSNAKKTGFTNFTQRDYDFDELERQLLQSQN